MTMKMRVVMAVICAISILATIGILSRPFSSPRKASSTETVVATETQPAKKPTRTVERVQGSTNWSEMVELNGQRVDYNPTQPDVWWQVMADNDTNKVSIPLPPINSAQVRHYEMPQCYNLRFRIVPAPGESVPKFSNATFECRFGPPRQVITN